MKDISKKLCDQDTVVCGRCGRFFNEAKGIGDPCPNCGSEGLYWITYEGLPPLMLDKGVVNAKT